MTTNGNDILRLKNVTKTFSGVAAVNDVSFNVNKGIIKALIGPNGAGKTTLLNMISGLLEPDSGYIYFEADTISHSPPHEIARCGIGRTFQLLRLFTANNATVLDNVMLGANNKLKPNILKSLFLRAQTNKAEKSTREAAFEILKLVGLENAAYLSPLTLSFGSQRMVELARALMSQPKLLLLDEPASGLNDAEVDEFMETLLTIKEKGVTILLIEHNMKVVMNLADDITVIDFGEKIAEGNPHKIANDPEVIRAYLGDDHIGERD
ncbi:MAG TPA: ABC transporter ATP-binding protein [Syntrophorhabdaceae bacterium]|nr:ABC transporter ATP-binding protein [Syntrophorhabdaceae bacterium]HNT69327.1 ABC transporter ATP-binding protein [Syntrophorhabdaceae bacterium]